MMGMVEFVENITDKEETMEKRYEELIKKERELDALVNAIFDKVKKSSYSDKYMLADSGESVVSLVKYLYPIEFGKEIANKEGE